MRRKEAGCFLCATLILQFAVFVAAEADASILPSAQHGRHHLQQFQSRPPVDLRQQLSVSQQAQILSDVQQHQHRFNIPQQNAVAQQPQQPTTPYPSLAKYKVDRNKQQSEQQQQLQQRQQKLGQQLGQNYLQTAQTQLQPQTLKQQPHYTASLSEQYNQYHPAPGNYQSLQHDLSQPLYNDQQSLQLQNYFDKQRQLEILQRQRDQLLLEQQELRRQQELLRLQQLRQLTSTTTPQPTQTLTPQTSQPSSVTTPFSLLLSSPSARRITPQESDLFLKAISSHQKKYSTTARSTTPKTSSTTPRPTAEPKEQTQEATNEQRDIPKDVLSLIRAQESQLVQAGKSKPQIKVIYQTEKPTDRQRVPSKGKTSSSYNASERDLLLKQLKLALTRSNDGDDGDGGASRNVTTRDLVLPNGKRLQVIHAPNGLSSIPNTGSSTAKSAIETPPTTTTTIKPPKAILEELTQGVLPPGADFEVIRHKDDGKLEDVGKLPLQNLPPKRVTFVVLEEQADGSYKVQGVKGNGEKDGGGDVESIVEKIKTGELKLPPSSLNPSPSPSSVSFAAQTHSFSPTAQPSILSAVTVNAVTDTVRTTTIRPTTLPNVTKSSKSGSNSDNIPFVTISPNFFSPTENFVTPRPTKNVRIIDGTSTSGPSSSRPTYSSTRETLTYSTVTPKYTNPTRKQFYPTMPPVTDIVTTTPSPIVSPTYTYIRKSSTSPSPRSISSTTRSISPSTASNVIYEEKFERSTPFPKISSTERPLLRAEFDASLPESLTKVLKREGLYAMAKFLRQSGLDAVLNETGPYTLFVPTDKAFRTLLVQLGGPEKAEQKFLDNPRLLSGLLLHHVIPGAFRIDSLQDEMTGVSLAGTQLRVNVYAMHDHEWNDVRVTAINGARVAPDKRNIEIPQGIAHAIDRVMFPLPVGDLVQTLQADRERRFTTFLRILHASGLEDTLAGTKTFTIFAPTDTAFVNAAAQTGSDVWTEAEGSEGAKSLISRHVIPTTLYTAGMRYYQQKDTLHSQTPIHIHKNGGRIRANDAHVITYNVPATNGVIHAIDALL